MPRVYKRPATRRDLIQHYVYLAESAGDELADRFLERVEASFGLLAEQPDIGAPITTRHPRLTGLRKWRVKDFENFLIFYLPRHDGISVVRVIYGAQDWWGLLGIS